MDASGKLEGLCNHSIRAARCPVEPNMWVILLEAAIAVILLLLIVWFTLPSRRKNTQQDEDRNE